MTPLELFPGPAVGEVERLGPQACVLRGFASSREGELIRLLGDIERVAPFRHMETPGGFKMSMASTNCGGLGWTSDRGGYRYSSTDPMNGRPWPAMPPCLSRLAHEAAAAAGFPGFCPDAGLINRYLPGSRLSLHQDRNELDFSAPIVSVSLGMTATFLFGGQSRSERPAKVALYHGDVVVWGGVDRLRFHGVMPLKDVPHPQMGGQRINLTLRRAG